MKFSKHFALLCLLGALITGCFDDNDDVPRVSSTAEINSFIYRSMKFWYLYKSDVSDLADDRFSSNQEFSNFIEEFDSPRDIFAALRTKRIDPPSGLKVDDFSFITDNYVLLERQSDGITRNNGMDFALFTYPNDDTKVFGVVRYVLPNTDAEAKGIKRGDIFNTIDGTQITNQNFRQLQIPDLYTIGLATFDGIDITPTGTSISLTKVQYTENPVLTAKTLNVGGNPVGYLMYNAFTRNFDDELNVAFAKFKADGVTDLVLDVRYNGGGDTETAKDLASMITGQFNGQVFTTEEWNADLQERFGGTNLFDNKIRTGDAINSLNLSRLYVLTTNRSASASELVINGLDPYINVIKVGTTTRGKFQASVLVYDSNNFGRLGANIGHTYAIRPLVLKSINSAGFTDYFNGFAPDIEVIEDRKNNTNGTNLGILGDENEPLLRAALDNILGIVSSAKNYTTIPQLESVGNSDMFEPNYEVMYKDLDLSAFKN